MENSKEKSRKYLSKLERFFNKVNTQGNCWLWTGAHHQDGYGVFNSSPRLVGSHRWLYEEIYGRLPKGLEIDHVCRTPACVKPSHLEAVTHSVNVKRGTAGQRCTERSRLVIRCPKGHEYSQDNTYITPGKPTRHCRQCVRDRCREYQRKLQDKANGLGLSSRQYKQAIARAEKKS